jgi:hypothetical protein
MKLNTLNIFCLYKNIARLLLGQILHLIRLYSATVLIRRKGGNQFKKYFPDVYD